MMTGAFSIVVAMAWIGYIPQAVLLFEAGFSLLGCFVWLVVLLTAITIVVAYNRARLRDNQTRVGAIFAGRSPIDDEEFALELGSLTAEQRDACMPVRSLLAKELGVSRELIRASDDAFALGQGELWGTSDISNAVQNAVGQELDEWFVWEQASLDKGPIQWRTVADILRFYIDHWGRLFHEPSERQ